MDQILPLGIFDMMVIQEIQNTPWPAALLYNLKNGCKFVMCSLNTQMKYGICMKSDRLYTLNPQRLKKNSLRTYYKYLSFVFYVHSTSKSNCKIILTRS